MISNPVAAGSSGSGGNIGWCEKPGNNIPLQVKNEICNIYSPESLAPVNLKVYGLYDKDKQCFFLPVTVMNNSRNTLQVRISNADASKCLIAAYTSDSGGINFKLVDDTGNNLTLKFTECATIFATVTNPMGVA